MEIYGFIPSCRSLKPPAGGQPLNKIALPTDTFAWNAVLQSHLTAGEPHLAVVAYRKMLLSGAVPDRHSLPRALAAARLSSSFFAGRQVHCHALKLRLAGDSFVISAIVELYSRFAGVDAAASVLFFCNPKSCIPWSLLAKFYLLEKRPSSALQVFLQSADSGVSLDAVLLATAARACGEMKSVPDAKKVHEIAKGRGFDRDLLVGNSLLKMYVECGKIEESRALFDFMMFKDEISWTTVIAGMVRHGEFNEGLKLLREMATAGANPDEFTVSAALPACARMAAGKQGKEIHGYIVRHRIEMNTTVQNALMDMYAKSGSVDIAAKVFDEMAEKDEISWTVMIMAYSLHGKGEMGISLFREMEKRNRNGTEPDRKTLLAALHACNTARMVEEGRDLFNRINGEEKRSAMTVMVSLLARSGMVEEARAFAKENGMADLATSQTAVIAGCRIHGARKTGLRIAERILERDPMNVEIYVILSNTYWAMGKPGKAKVMRQMMMDMGLKAKKACSWIEIGGKIHAFGTGDLSHPRSQRIYWELERLRKRMEQEEGYEDVEDFCFHEVDEERECVPIGHSEMLAIGLGLVSGGHGRRTAVRVTKNMRVCRNCHESGKKISNITGREILLRDPERFHRFVDGLCSCQDFW
ncbi:Pentatricopeptide repeat-containing protein [Apostasia shenzhenica]|uniref:Pentatricopeptide repeat-containing protein n=1 Tax=Apostasia shenzhenica TaxID=1088818 RepID=A0A2I0AH22_9ASPA|nr:Pentatricopeptide repeat-containing protein [Apostasia shenzhenica]